MLESICISKKIKNVIISIHLSFPLSVAFRIVQMQIHLCSLYPVGLEITLHLYLPPKCVNFSWLKRASITTANWPWKPTKTNKWNRRRKRKRKQNELPSSLRRRGKRRTKTDQEFRSWQTRKQRSYSLSWTRWGLDGMFINQTTVRIVFLICFLIIYRRRKRRRK